MSHSLRHGDTGRVRADLHKHSEWSLATKCVRRTRPTPTVPVPAPGPQRGAGRRQKTQYPLHGGQGTGGQEPMPGRWGSAGHALLSCGTSFPIHKLKDKIIYVLKTVNTSGNPSVSSRSLELLSEFKTLLPSLVLAEAYFLSLISKAWHDSLTIWNLMPGVFFPDDFLIPILFCVICF